MVMANANHGIPPAESDPQPSVNRPVGPLGGVIDFRRLGSATKGIESIDGDDVGTDGFYMDRPRLTAADIRVHAHLAESVALIYYRRHGLWPKVRRFFAGLTRTTSHRA